MNLYNLFILKVHKYLMFKHFNSLDCKQNSGTDNMTSEFGQLYGYKLAQMGFR